MIKAYLLKRNKSKSLRTQIRNVERELLNRQQRTGVRTATLVRKIQQQMTAPATLLLAGGIGFILGELTQRQTAKSRGAADKLRTTETTPLRTGLNLITSIHTLYTALPLAWMMKSFHQQVQDVE
jgi:2-phosphoglycerate kinase